MREFATDDRWETLAEEAHRAFCAVPVVAPAPFVPDAGQVEALDAIRSGDTLLVAPTGYGKSWVAYEAIRDTLARGGVSYYTTPLKALSNQKLVDLGGVLGEENVGILTGDRQENATAPVLVATTEILRNVLMRQGTIARSGQPCLIVLDEAHWIADPERGTTWEELLLLAPAEARLLLLSASIGNPDEIAAWLEQVRSAAPSLVTVEERPVPQRWGAVDRRGTAIPLDLARKNVRRLGNRPDLPTLVAALKRDGLTPALVFLPTRWMCDEAADACQRRLGRQVITRPHHAGLTLATRLKIESELKAGEVDAIFATTTLASGIDAPVRTVVLGSLHDGRGEPLSSTIVQQMAGRAGRRGRDAVGFVLVWSSRLDDLEIAGWIAREPPMPLASSFQPTYQTALALSSRHGADGARAFAERSLATFQRWDRIGPLREHIAAEEAELGTVFDDLRPRACVDPETTRPTFEQDRRMRRGRGRRGPVQVASTEPCPDCPAFKPCGKLYRQSRGRRAQLHQDLLELREVDPVAQIDAALATLRALGCANESDQPTEMGQALLATHDPAGLFVALERKRLAMLTPLELARVAAATREMRIGVAWVAGPSLPGWYEEAVRDAAAREKVAHGLGSLSRLVSDLEPPDEPSRRGGWTEPRFLAPVLSQAERRARAIARVWRGMAPSGEDVAPGDLERLLLLTLDFVRDLRDIPELKRLATATYNQLRQKAAAYLTVADE